MWALTAATRQNAGVTSRCRSTLHYLVLRLSSPSTCQSATRNAVDAPTAGLVQSALTSSHTHTHTGRSIGQSAQLLQLTSNACNNNTRPLDTTRSPDVSITPRSRYIADSHACFSQSYIFHTDSGCLSTSRPTRSCSRSDNAEGQLVSPFMVGFPHVPHLNSTYRTVKERTFQALVRRQEGPSWSELVEFYIDEIGEIIIIHYYIVL